MLKVFRQGRIDKGDFVDSGGRDEQAFGLALLEGIRDLTAQEANR